MVASETRLSRYIPDSDFHLDGYNIFRTDRRAKGGGVVIYTKKKHFRQQFLYKILFLNNMNYLN